MLYPHQVVLICLYFFKRVRGKDISLVEAKKIAEEEISFFIAKMEKEG